MKRYLWTRLSTRLQFIKSVAGATYNWLFLPGGPGLGSESLILLTDILNLPGTTWHIDLPGDGSNTTLDDEKYFSQWQDALLEAVSSLGNVILVAHSTGGMYALSTPGLEPLLTGLIIMASAPDNSWQKLFMDYVQANPVKDLQSLQLLYTNKPSNELLKELTVASAVYSFMPEKLDKGIELFKMLPYNYKVCTWSEKYFDPFYKASWVPKEIPTLIFGGEQDHIISLDHFIRLVEFQQDNIIILPIKDAGHYPWIDNPLAVIEAFKYYQFLLK